MIIWAVQHVRRYVPLAYGRSFAFSNVHTNTLCPFLSQEAPDNLQSAGDVTKNVTTSAYATTVFFYTLCPILMPVRCRSNGHISRFKTTANSIMNIGQSNLTEHCRRKGPAI